MKAVPDERRFRRNLYNFGKQQLQTPVCYLPENLKRIGLQKQDLIICFLKL